MRTDVLATVADWVCPVCGGANRIEAPGPLEDETIFCEKCGEEFIVREIHGKVGTLKKKSQLEKKIEERVCRR